MVERIQVNSDAASSQHKWHEATIMWKSPESKGQKAKLSYKFAGCFPYVWNVTMTIKATCMKSLAQNNNKNHACRLPSNRKVWTKHFLDRRFVYHSNCPLQHPSKELRSACDVPPIKTQHGQQSPLEITPSWIMNRKKSTRLQIKFNPLSGPVAMWQLINCNYG